MTTIPAFGVFTFNGFSAELDIIETDKKSAAKHKRELTNDFGFDTGEVKIVEMPDESGIYRIIELMEEKDMSFTKALKQVKAEIAAPVEVKEVRK